LAGLVEFGEADLLALEDDLSANSMPFFLAQPRVGRGSANNPVSTMLLSFQ
jgi:hypothetical protein